MFLRSRARKGAIEVVAASGFHHDAATASPHFSEQQQIQQWISAHGTPQQVALRCRIVLASSQGLSDVAIAKQFSINRKTVILWRKRFAQQRLDGLWAIAPGRGRKPVTSLVDATLQTKPKGMTHWSCFSARTPCGRKEPYYGSCR